MIVKKSFHVVTTLMLLINVGCGGKDYDNEDLTYRGQFVYNDQLKLNGLYYRIDNDIRYVICFYENGVCFRSGTAVHFDPNISNCHPISDGERKFPWCWGQQRLSTQPHLFR